MGEAAAVEAVVEPLEVPNFSCRRRTSRGGLATELTNAIFTCRPERTQRSESQFTSAFVNRSDGSGEALPTFGLVGVGGADVLGEQLQPLFSLVVQPQVHLPPRLELLRRFPFEVPLAVTLPELV